MLCIKLNLDNPKLLISSILNFIYIYIEEVSEIKWYKWMPTSIYFSETLEECISEQFLFTEYTDIIINLYV